MAEAASTGNFDNLEGLHTTLYDVEAVPYAIWKSLHSVMRDSLRSHVPESDRERVDEIVGDLPRFRETRAHPQIIVDRESWTPKEGKWNPQLIRDVTVAVMSEGAEPKEDNIVGGVIVEHATSARVARKLHLSPNSWPTHSEEKIKMNLPPRWPIPVIGGKRNIHLRELFQHPDAQGEPIDWDHEVGGVVLFGLWRSLALPHPSQKLRAYDISDDPVDTELTQTMRLLGGAQFSQREHGFAGFKVDASLTGKVVTVSEARDIIETESIGYERLMDSDRVHRVAKPELKKSKYTFRDEMHDQEGIEWSKRPRP